MATHTPGLGVYQGAKRADDAQDGSKVLETSATNRELTHRRPPKEDATK